MCVWEREWERKNDEAQLTGTRWRADFGACAVSQYSLLQSHLWSSALLSYRVYVSSLKERSNDTDRQRDGFLLECKTGS